MKPSSRYKAITVTEVKLTEWIGKRVVLRVVRNVFGCGIRLREQFKLRIVD